MGLLSFTGTYCVASPHPHERGTILAAYLDASGNLKTLLSYDAGDTWAAGGTAATGLTFTASGRAGLCWLGGIALLVYASGNNLLAQISRDAGQTWAAAVTVATAGPYQGISAVGSPTALGTLYAAACTGTSAPLTPHVFRSGDDGATWATLTGAPPAPGSSGAALGFDGRTCRLLWGTQAHSDDDGVTWTAD